jgi:hypothetical protein
MVWDELLVADPLDIFTKDNLLSAIAKLSGSAVGVVDDILRSLERSAFLKKGSKSARTERMRRVSTNNASVREAAFQHSGGINPCHWSSTKFSAVAAGRGEKRPRRICAQSGNIEICVKEVFKQVMNGKFLLLAAFGA